jgi:hypothetical protein
VISLPDGVGHELVVEQQSLTKPPFKAMSLKLRTQPRRDVRRNRDAALTAMRQKAKG